MTEDEMVGWHHQLNGHESEQTPGDGEGQESLVCCSPWGCKESDTTECLNNNKTLTPTLVPTFNLPSSETTSINFLGIHPVIFYICIKMCIFAII